MRRGTNRFITILLSQKAKIVELLEFPAESHCKLRIKSRNILYLFTLYADNRTGTESRGLRRLHSNVHFLWDKLN